MKKLLLSLGTAVTLVAPLATVVACGDDAKTGSLVKPEYDAATEMLINDIPEYTHHSSQFGSAREAEIKAVWPKIQTEAGSAAEVMAMIAEAAYADDVAADGWEATLEEVKVRLLGGTTDHGDVINGWAYAESQRIQKDIIFADLKNTVKYEKVTGLEPGTDEGYTAGAGEVLINDWTTFDDYAGLGASAEDAMNNGWDTFKNEIFSLQGLVNYIGFYGYSQDPDNQESWLAGNVDNYIKDYIATNGTKLAFKDGTVISNDVSLTGENTIGSIVDNGDSTTTVTLATIAGIDLTTSANLANISDGSDITVTATAQGGYTVNGTDSEDFTVTINAPEAVAAGTTTYGFHDDDATAGEDHSALFEAVITPSETATKVYTKAGVTGASTSSNYNVLKIGSSSDSGAIKFSNPGSTITKIEIVGAGWSDTAATIIGGTDFTGTNSVTEDMARYVGDSNAAIGTTPGWSSTYTFDFSANPISEGSFILTTDKTITGGSHTSIIIEDIIVHTS